jgi:hypothetical protein
MRLFFAIIIALNSAYVLTNGAEFSFSDTSHKFGDTREGVVLKHHFTFQNIGDTPLVINGYRVACSCTKVFYPEKPVAPGGTGIIKMEFDTNEKYGYQKRKIDILSNAKKMTLSFKVFVFPND